jgi:hypothetical protein
LLTGGLTLIVLIGCFGVTAAQKENNLSIKYDDITDSTICIDGKWHILKTGSVLKKEDIM